MQEVSPVPRWEDFTKCPTCTYNIATGEGVRGCEWGECPYLPEELEIHCAWCWFDFFTMEGNPPCEDPMTCEHGAEPRANVPNVLRWLEMHGPPVTTSQG
jgi:hypothetical protein